MIFYIRSRVPLFTPVTANYLFAEQNYQLLTEDEIRSMKGEFRASDGPQDFDALAKADNNHGNHWLKNYVHAVTIDEAQVPGNKIMAAGDVITGAIYCGTLAHFVPVDDSLHSQKSFLHRRTSRDKLRHIFSNLFKPGNAANSLRYQCSKRMISLEPHSKISEISIHATSDYLSNCPFEDLRPQPGKGFKGLDKLQREMRNYKENWPLAGTIAAAAKAAHLPSGQ